MSSTLNDQIEHANVKRYMRTSCHDFAEAAIATTTRSNVPETCPKMTCTLDNRATKNRGGWRQRRPAPIHFLLPAESEGRVPDNFYRPLKRTTESTAFEDKPCAPVKFPVRLLRPSLRALDELIEQEDTFIAQTWARETARTGRLNDKALLAARMMAHRRRADAYRERAKRIQRLWKVAL